MTGPLYLPSSSSSSSSPLSPSSVGAGDSSVPVPTHFFKAVLCENGGDACWTHALLVPNASSGGRNLEACAVPIERIERLAGIELFVERVEGRRSLCGDFPEACVFGRGGMTKKKKKKKKNS